MTYIEKKIKELKQSNKTKEWLENWTKNDDKQDKSNGKTKEWLEEWSKQEK